MPDYKLEALGTRSFEHLVQSLALREISPGITPFGDGPDGGREAVFDGAVDFPSSTAPWDGYGVIQAKFLQRPIGADADGKWAIAELKNELAKYEDVTSGRRMPTYYVFATNATLSAVDGKGKKDLVTAVLESFAQRNGLKGYDIWDYDKIRILLDNNNDVRTSYDAWILPGDVLSAVIKRLDGLTPSFANVITRYLSRELVDNQYARLRQAGHSGNHEIPLAHVFVDIPFVGRPDRHLFGMSAGFIVAKLLEIAETKLDPASEVEEGAVVQRGKSRFALIGGPGQGKTTVVQFICQLYRASLLQSRPKHTLMRDVQETLRTLHDQRISEGLGLPGARRFPVHIVLNEMAKFLADAPEEESSVFSFLSDRMTRRLKQKVSSDDLRRWIAEYPWFVVFDGLDEVPASTNREQVLNAVHEFLLDARSDSADLMVLATSRPQGYTNEFSEDLYTHLRLAQLGAEHALHYANRLVSMRYGSDSERAATVYARLERAAQEESVSRLMTTPLQVAIMAQLVDRVGRPPQERYNLFRAYYDVIYSRELERDIPAAQILREYKTDIDAIHWRVGLTLQTRSELDGGTEARLTRREFASLVDGRLVEEEHEGGDLARLSSAITEAAAHRLVFLVGHESDAIGFEIRSLQEFMAAEALHDSRESVVQSRLRRIARITHWRNVLLFAIGRCFAVDQALRDTVVMICRELNAEDESGKVNSRLMAGSELALDVLEEGSCRRQPKYTRHLLECALDGLEADYEERSKRLAELAIEAQRVEFVITSILAMGISGRNHLGLLRTALWLSARGFVEADDVVRNWHAEGTVTAADVFVEGISAGAFGLVSSLLYTLLSESGPDDVLYRVGVHGAGGLDPTPSSGHADWQAGFIRSTLSNYLGLHSDARIRLTHRLSNSRSDLFFYVSSVETSGGLLGFKEIPSELSEWTYFRQVGIFAGHPCADTLAAVIEARGDTVRLPVFFGSPSWPLACVLRRFHRPNDFPSGNAIRGGCLGDIEDWLAAERRWQRNGITLADIEHSLENENDAPFSGDIGNAGFPLVLLVNRVRLGKLTPAPRAYSDLLALKRAAPPSVGRSHLSRAIANLLLDEIDNSPSEEAAAAYMECVDDVLAFDAGGLHFSIDTVLRVLSLLPSGDSRVDAIETLGANRFVRTNMRIDSHGLGLRELVESFEMNPDSIGHARIIARLAEVRPFDRNSGEVRRILDLCDPLKESLGVVDYQILKVAASGLDGDLSGLIEVHRRAKDSYALASRLSSVVAVQGVAPVLQEELCVALYDEEARSGRQSGKNLLLRRLKDLREHWRAGIDSSSVCGELELPIVVSVVANL